MPDGDGIPVLTVALSPGRLLRRVTLCIERMLYDDRRPVALFGALEEFLLILTPNRISDEVRSCPTPIRSD